MKEIIIFFKRKEIFHLNSSILRLEVQSFSLVIYLQSNFSIAKQTLIASESLHEHIQKPPQVANQM